MANDPKRFDYYGQQWVAELTGGSHEVASTRYVGVKFRRADGTGADIYGSIPASLHADFGRVPDDRLVDALSEALARKRCQELGVPDDVEADDIKATIEDLGCECAVRHADSGGVRLWGCAVSRPNSMFAAGIDGNLRDPKTGKPPVVCKWPTEKLALLDGLRAARDMSAPRKPEPRDE
jgi:hypothetical protein